MLQNLAVDRVGGFALKFEELVFLDTDREGHSLAVFVDGFFVRLGRCFEFEILGELLIVAVVREIFARKKEAVIGSLATGVRIFKQLQNIVSHILRRGGDVEILFGFVCKIVKRAVVDRESLSVAKCLDNFGREACAFGNREHSDFSHLVDHAKIIDAP